MATSRAASRERFRSFLVSMLTSFNLAITKLEAERIKSQRFTVTSIGLANTGHTVTLRFPDRSRLGVSCLGIRDARP